MTDFAEETYVQASSKRRWSSKATSSNDQACTTIMDYYNNKLAISSTKEESDDPFSIKNCIALLSTIPDVSKEIYFKASKVMAVNRDWRELFMTVLHNTRQLMLTLLDLEQY